MDSPPLAVTPAKAPLRPVRAWAMIFVLCLLFVVSMVDRFAMGLLVEPLKNDLGVSDVQIGLLFGSAFAIFYGAVSIPMARLADRGNRVQLIIVAVVVWSACTVLSGFASTFTMLVLLRMGLALGESALVPAGYSLIADALPLDRRTLGGAFFNACGMAGASGAYIVTSGALGLTAIMQESGWLSEFRPWQVVFILIGLPGLVLTLILAVVGREPPRVVARGAPEATSLLQVIHYVRGQGWLYFGLFLGAGFLQLGTNGFLAWGPTYMSRAFDMPITVAGRLYGTYNLAAFVGGSLTIPVLAVWLTRHRRDSIVLIGSMCAVASCIFCVASVLQSSPTGFLLCSFAGLFLATGGAAHAISSLHPFAPSHMRATLVAFMLLCLTSLALGLAPPLVGGISTVFGTGKAALGLGLGAVSIIGATASVFFFFAARRRVLAYTHEAPSASRGPASA